MSWAVIRSLSPGFADACLAQRRSTCSCSPTLRKMPSSVLPFEGEGCTAPGHAQGSDFRQHVEQLFSHAVAEVFVVLVRAQVHERQHCDRFLIGDRYGRPKRSTNLQLACLLDEQTTNRPRRQREQSRRSKPNVKPGTSDRSPAFLPVLLLMGPARSASASRTTRRSRESRVLLCAAHREWDPSGRSRNARFRCSSARARQTPDRVREDLAQRPQLHRAARDDRRPTPSQERAKESGDVHPVRALEGLLVFSAIVEINPERSEMHPARMIGIQFHRVPNDGGTPSRSRPCARSGVRGSRPHRCRAD